MSDFQDLRRRWESLRVPRLPRTGSRALVPREAPGRRLAVWPERVVVTPAEVAPARLPLPPVGRGIPVARLLGSDGRPTGWAAVQPGTGELALSTDAGPLWVQLQHEGFRYPAPGSADLQLGPEGLAGRVLRAPHGFELLLVNGGARSATFRLACSEPWLELDASEVPVGADSTVTLHGWIRPGALPPPGATAVVEVSAAGHRAGEVTIEVGPWPPPSGLRVACTPTDLGVLRAGTSLQVQLSADRPLKGFLQVGVLPRPLVHEFRLEPGVPLRVELPLAADALPRVERGRLRVLAVTDAPRPSERTTLVEIPWRRIKLRRNVPRVRLAPSATNPHPHQAVSVRRSDGGPVRLSWRLSEGLEPLVQVHQDQQGQLVVWCSAPATPCQGEIHVMEGETGLQETIPVQVEGRTR